ncbi:palmitoyltransferase [Achlya hypogyna]|uniref:Palmitoyltransferase n=1 Tax=Achlya hypogyna TaxID=1202772 RepID=A0A1V9ZAB0_ACHHY|nr:palmitoyltransferase [Achlya hypogyna]
MAPTSAPINEATATIEHLRAPMCAPVNALPPMTSTARPAKRVRFSCVTAYEFALGHGGSSVPLENGPAVGLVGAPVRVTAAKIVKKRSTAPRRLRKLGKDERVAILQGAGHPMKEIVDFCVEALDIRISRGANRRRATKRRSSEVERNTEINENANIDYCLHAIPRALLTVNRLRRIFILPLARHQLGQRSIIRHDRIVEVEIYFVIQASAAIEPHSATSFVAVFTRGVRTGNAAASMTAVPTSGFVHLVQTTASALAKSRQSAKDVTSEGEQRLAVVHQALLDNPGLISTVDVDGHSPLHWAAQLGPAALLQLLLDHGGSVFECDAHGLLPLHWAAAANNLPTLQLLLAQPGAAIDSVDTLKSQTALVIAAQHGHTMAVIYLLKRGANPTVTDSSHDNFIHWAAYKGAIEILQLCHSFAEPFGFDIALFHAADAFGQTPLHLAAAQGHLTCVEFLVEELEANAAAEDAKAQTPLELAKQRGHAAVYAYLSGKFTPAWNRQLGHAVYFWCIRAMNAEAVSIRPFLGSKCPFYFMLGNVLVGIYWVVAEFQDPTQLVLQSLAWAGLFCAWRIPPGSVTNDLALRASYTARMRQLLGDNDVLQATLALDTVDLCHACAVEKPRGAKHCRFCKTCILRFDHHCPFIDNCVGQRNYTYFLIFVGVMAVAAAHMVYLWGNAQPLSASAVIAAIYYAGVAAVAGNLFFFHLFLGTLDLSTNEYRHRHRAKDITNRRFDKFESPCRDDCAVKCLARLCMSLPRLSRVLPGGPSLRDKLQNGKVTSV